MSDHKPPKGFVGLSKGLQGAVISKNIKLIRSLLQDAAIERDRVLSTLEESWWNALLTMGQVANEELSTEASFIRQHAGLEKRSIAKLFDLLLLSNGADGFVDNRVRDRYYIRLGVRLGLVKKNWMGKYYLTGEAHSDLGSHHRFCQKGSKCVLRHVVRKYRSLYMKDKTAA